MANLVKAKPFNLRTPQKAAQISVQALGGIAKLGQIFAQDDDDVWTNLLGFLDELELPQAAPPGFIVAGDDDLLLLDGQRQRLERRVLCLQYGCIEAIIILCLGLVAKRQCRLLEPYKVDDDAAVLLSRHRHAAVLASTCPELIDRVSSKFFDFDLARLTIMESRPTSLQSDSRAGVQFRSIGFPRNSRL